MIAHDTASYGILYSGYAEQRGVVTEGLEKLGKGIETDGLHLAVAEILAGGGIVKAAGHTLYAYSYLLFHIIKNAPRLPAYGALYQ